MNETLQQLDSYNARRRRYRRKQTTGKFICVDGEGFTTSEHGHYYALLAASTGDYLYNEYGLTTSQCVNWLLELKRKHKGYKFVGFAFNYDVNMILVDLLERELRQLWNTGQVAVRLDDGIAYGLEWLPTKSFRICRLYDKLAIEITDSFGFFQSSFVKALEAWNIEDPDGSIARMKAERSQFTPAQAKAVIAYALSECRLLERLMLALEQALLDAELRPAKWNGAGAVAAAMLQRERVQAHKVNDEDFPAPVHEAIMRSYFGGRVEVFVQGLMEKVTNYDIRSAYPSIARELPSLLLADWSHRTSYTDEAYGLWLVRWDIPAEHRVMPFPYRRKGSISYPSAGYGWYHSSEVAVAMKYYGQYLQVEEGWILQPFTDSKPFAFIDRVYAERVKAKAEGLASEKALKLGLNSLYGKTAQGIGYNNTVPRFRSFLWAGMITAGTRARLLDYACQAPNSCVSVATDGIVFLRDPKLETSDVLGGLERQTWAELFVAQPGIYRAIDEDGKEYKKTRGFFLKELDFDDLLEGWKREGPYYQQTRPTKRFVGIGSALQSKDLSQWRTWPDGTRTLKLYSSRKYYQHRKPTMVMRLLPAHYPNAELSDAYVPKSRGVETDGFSDAIFVAGIEQPTIDL